MRVALLTVAAVLVAVPATAGPALAHDSIVGSEPADGSTVASAPSQVRITFEEPPMTAGLGVAVTAPSGASVASGGPTIDGNAVVQALVPLVEAGSYTVAYRVVSQDGHPVSGTVHFTYSGSSSSASSSAAPSASATTSVVQGTDPLPSGSSSTSPTPWIIVGAVALLVLVALVGLVLRGRSG